MGDIGAFPVLMGVMGVFLVAGHDFCLQMGFHNFLRIMRANYRSYVQAGATCRSDLINSKRAG